MTTIILAKDVGMTIFQELQQFAIEQYGEEGEALLAAFLDGMSFTMGTE